ncbi:MAG TPA: 3-keto-5-aminohexanoate cleavage protein [Candidatus Dormibacteraeota bacterium]|nr:3-keto-5-aminohexanoate cleavage protein [Candidatus Dormibacteraeota bacterium]
MAAVKACLNGSREPGAHAALPVTAAELAEAARAAAEAGAFAVHVHPRDAGGAQTLEPGPSGDAVAAIRAAVPGLPVGLSTGAWIEPDPDRRLRMISGWDPRPDFVSVNLHEPGATELIRALPGLSIGVEAGVWTALSARRLVDEDLARLCLRVLVEPRDPEVPAALTTIAAVDAVLDEAGVGLQRVYHGRDATAWPVLEAMLARGRDVRVGLEDVLTLADGRPARDNAELVAAALALASSHTR